jgi:hypothetical protein
MQRHNAAAAITRLARQVGITWRVTPFALRCSYITIGLLQGVTLREMQRAVRHAKADTTVAYDQSERSFHRVFVLVMRMAASAIGIQLPRADSPLATVIGIGLTLGISIPVYRVLRDRT